LISGRIGSDIGSLEGCGTDLLGQAVFVHLAGGVVGVGFVGGGDGFEQDAGDADVFGGELQGVSGRA
jgi:hypothetical protein